MSSTTAAHTTTKRAIEKSEIGTKCLPVVHVRFTPRAGRRLRRPEPTSCPIGGAFWTERPILMKRAHGDYELIGTAANLEGLARWILSFGEDAEVKGPDRLERKVATEARRVWKLYENE